MLPVIRDYTKNKNLHINMPDLIEVQHISFQDFIENGLKRAFASAFPVEDMRGRFVLEFLDAAVGKPSIDPDQAKRKGLTYTAPMRARFRLINQETGEAQDETVFMGHLPMMTHRGTFIVSGTERVVVSQMVRSPGVYFQIGYDDMGRSVASADIIPNRGAWLRIESSGEGVIYARMDRSQRRIPVTTLLKALGAGDNQSILEMFAHHPLIDLTMDVDETSTQDEAVVAIYKAQNPGEPPTIEGSYAFFRSLFVDPRRYDLAPVGRYKMNQRLDVLRRAHQCRAAAPVMADGQVLLEKGERIDRAAVPHDVYIDRVMVDVGPDTFPVPLLGNGRPSEDQRTLTVGDLFSIISFLIGMRYGIGQGDDIDHLGNRRVRTVGELLENQAAIGMARIAKNIRNRFASLVDEPSLTAKTLISTRPLTSALREFLGTSQLSQFMDQTNSLSETTHKRRLSALGPGGLKQETATLDTRDVHHSHYGRICPIETPEGQNVGLITSLSTFARVNPFGFIETPYRRVDKKTGRVLDDEIVYLTADEEETFVIAPFDAINEEGYLRDEQIVARHRGEIQMVAASEVDYVDVAPSQVIGLSASLIPFLENTDAIRAGMGANMQRQAVPLIHSEAPLVMTGNERRAALDSQAVVVARRGGTVSSVTSGTIVVRTDDGDDDVYRLMKFVRTNNSTCFNQKPVVHPGQRVETGDILADNSDTDRGYLALGRNVLVAYMSFEGFNYEDAIVISDRLVKEDVFTSLHIDEYEIDVRDTKLGPEQLSPEIPGVSARNRSHLDEQGIAVVGARVGPGDILVGKLTPKAEKPLTQEERMIQAIFGKQSQPMKDASLRMPHGEYGLVIGHEILARDEGDDLPPDVLCKVRVYVAQKRKISIGDKMSGRHGNKGVIAKVLPEADMPFLPDGRRVDIVLSPLGVPSRMNIGQILECHLGFAAQQAGYHAITPVFSGATAEDVLAALDEVGLAAKMTLYDGRTGEPFRQPVTVGYMYMLKLHHLVDEKIHARSTGPYSMVTQQPLGGKAQFGGQRLGEMEVWALEAYGAAHTLQEMLTVKSDDIGGRYLVWEALWRGLPVPGPQRSESLVVLMKELNGLGFGVRLLDKNGKEIDLHRDLSPKFHMDKEEGSDT